jgi:hypothetical protein
VAVEQMLSGWIVATCCSPQNFAHGHIEFLAGIFPWPVESDFGLF